VVATTPGLAETLQRDWRKAAQFYAHHGISENLYRYGVPAEEDRRYEDLTERATPPCLPKRL
jgi:hypothetical protein